MSRPFRVVTHRNWIAEHFADFGAVQDFGFDIDPETAEDTVWWAPGAWVARVWASGIRLPLTLCGPRWMENLGRHHSQRLIVVRRVDEVFDLLPSDREDKNWHVKLTEAKLDSFPAAVFPRRYLATSLAQFHTPPETLLQLSEVVDFTRECRFWIAHGKITAHSWYLIDGWLWDAEDFPADTPVPEEMFAAAEAVLADTQCPPGFTLDMGYTSDGRILVVEANAAWSSSPYNGDPGGIVESIVASHDFTGAYRRWRWRPNPVYGVVQPIKWSQSASRASQTSRSPQLRSENLSGAAGSSTSASSKEPSDSR